MAAAIRLDSDLVCPCSFIAEESGLVRLPREYHLALDWRRFERRRTGMFENRQRPPERV